MEEYCITVKVIPKSSKNSVQFENNVLRVHLNTPPVDGKANKALLELLAEVLRVSKSSIEIIHGEKGRNKLVKIKGLSELIFKQKLEEHNKGTSKN